jgi:hypothetical protein
VSEICYDISDMRDLTLKVLKRAKAVWLGSAFTPRAFADLGSRAAVDQALSRLSKAGTIRRISRGVYDVPKNHPTLGPLSPDPDSVARAIADQSGYRLQPTPARAANALGLSSQVPAQIVYLIDGSSRKIKVGNQTIHLGTQAQGSCWERVLLSVLLSRLFVHSGQTTSPKASSSSFGETCHQMQRLG